jgi:hypothetical protein
MESEWRERKAQGKVEETNNNLNVSTEQDSNNQNTTGDDNSNSGGNDSYCDEYDNYCPWG